MTTQIHPALSIALTLGAVAVLTVAIVTAVIQTISPLM